jgi:hypothetical protein
MWESIKNFFGFGKKEEVVVPVFEGKAEPKVVETPVETLKVEAPETPKAPKKSKAPKAKPVSKEEVKVTVKDIKAKVKKEAPKAEAPKAEVPKAEVKKASKPRKPKSKE